MKKNYFILLLALSIYGANAQDPLLTLPEYFELTEVDTNWNQFANAGDPPENMDLAENPDPFGINPSDSCLMFIVQDEADPWAGAYCDAYGTIDITNDNYILQMMVYKNVLSPCRMKLELGTTDNIEITVENTLLDFWELLSFDFSEVIGESFDRLTFFPDFPSPRETGSLCYIDNIGFEGTFDELSTSPFKSRKLSVFPNPTSDALNIKGEGISRITLTNLVGKDIKSYHLNNSSGELLDISDLKSGIYFVTVESRSGTTSHKFVKE